MNTVKQQIEKMADTLQAFTEEHYENRSYQIAVPNIIVSFGKKYAKIIKCRPGTDQPESVHSFVNMMNGDILKAASWKAPAKGVRGNVFDDNEGCVTAWDTYGARYL